MVSFCLSKSARGTRSDTHLTTLWTLICCFCCCCCSQLSTKRGGRLLLRSTVSVILFVSWMPFFTAFATPVSLPSKTAKRVFQLSADGSYLFSYDTGPGLHQSFREERRNTGGRVAGSYGYVDPKGALRITEYVADSKGYRASLEVYEPVHHFPSSKPLIVGPLPFSSERKEKKESVFEKYAFPIEPFESLKVSPPETIDSNVLLDSDVECISKGSMEGCTSAVSKGDGGRGDTATPSDVTDETTTTTNDTSLLTLGISTLQDELQLLSLRLRQERQEPVLIVGPLLGQFEEVNDLRFREPSKELPDGVLFDTKETGLNFLQDGARALQSPIRNSLTKTSHFPSKDFGFRKVIPSLSDLNFVERKMVLEGEKLSSFASLPSSSLLQGRFVTQNNTKGKNLPSRRHVRVKKRKLNASKSKNLTTTKLLFSDISNTNDASSAFRTFKNVSDEELLTNETMHDETTMKLISFQARNIFRELLKLNPRPKAVVAPLKSIKISQNVKKRPKQSSINSSSSEESDSKEM